MRYFILSVNNLYMYSSYQCHVDISIHKNALQLYTLSVYSDLSVLVKVLPSQTDNQLSAALQCSLSLASLLRSAVQTRAFSYAEFVRPCKLGLSFCISARSSETCRFNCHYRLPSTPTFNGRSAVDLPKNE